MFLFQRNRPCSVNQVSTLTKQGSRNVRYTVKASNFGLHENYEPLFFFRKDCYLQNVSCREMKEIKVVEELSI